MLLQIDPRFVSMWDGENRFHKWGCYEMVILWHMVNHKHFPLEIDMIENLTYVFIKNGWIRGDLYINNPDLIFNYFGMEIKTRHEGPHYTCKSNEFETLVFKAISPKTGKSYGHRVGGDGISHVTYDPFGYSYAVKHGALVTKRIHREV